MVIADVELQAKQMQQHLQLQQLQHIQLQPPAVDSKLQLEQIQQRLQQDLRTMEKRHRIQPIQPIISDCYVVDYDLDKYWVWLSEY